MLIGQREREREGERGEQRGRRAAREEGSESQGPVRTQVRPQDFQLPCPCISLWLCPCSCDAPQSESQGPVRTQVRPQARGGSNMDFPFPVPVFPCDFTRLEQMTLLVHVMHLRVRVRPHERWRSKGDWWLKTYFRPSWGQIIWGWVWARLQGFLLHGQHNTKS